MRHKAAKTSSGQLPTGVSFIILLELMVLIGSMFDVCIPQDIRSA